MNRKKRAQQGASDKVRPLVTPGAILVPVDFSPPSLEALDFAVSLAQRLDASILLLHVLSPLHTPGRFDSPKLRSLRAEALQEAKRKLAKLAKQRVKPHAPVRHNLLKGLAHSGIVKYAAKAKVDLIVMASKARAGVSRFLIGSVTEKVIRQAPCSVLVVREKAR